MNLEETKMSEEQKITKIHDVGIGVTGIIGMGIVFFTCVLAIVALMIWRGFI